MQFFFWWRRTCNENVSLQGTDTVKTIRVVGIEINDIYIPIFLHVGTMSKTKLKVVRSKVKLLRVFLNVKRKYKIILASRMNYVIISEANNKIIS
jgi:hypothetical protein